MKRPESVLVLIYSEQGRVLMLQRDDDPDFWQSVTGTMEQNETPIQTAYREVEEEIGLRLDPSEQAIVDCRHINQYQIRPEWLYRYPQGSQYNTEYVFSLMTSEHQAITLSEHLQFRWLSKADAISLAWSASNREGIAQFVPDLI